jgi:AcrR family transcriptional regulator
MTRQLSARRTSTRKRILDAATRIFHERGFRRVTLDEVCAASGLTKKSFYQYFRAKDELVSAVVDGTLEQVSRGIDRAVQETHDDPYARILRLQRSVAVNLFMRLNVTFMRDVQTRRPDLWERIDARRQQLIDRLQQVIDEGQRRGVFRKDVDPRLVTTMMVAVHREVLDPDALVRSGFTHEVVFAHIFELFFHGILVQPRRSARRSS